MPKTKCPMQENAQCKKTTNETKFPMIQNAQLQNAQVTKRPLLFKRPKLKTYPQNPKYRQKSEKNVKTVYTIGQVRLG